MKKLSLIAILVCLSACSTTAKIEPKVIVETHYVVKIPPKELTTLPKKVKNIDIDKADQTEVAQWLIDKEQYTRTLENMIISIGSFFEDQQKILNNEPSK